MKVLLPKTSKRHQNVSVKMYMLAVVPPAEEELALMQGHQRSQVPGPRSLSSVLLHTLPFLQVHPTLILWVLGKRPALLPSPAPRSSEPNFAFANHLGHS
jgi:hypothetical protein